jgi:regulator of sirC expression with transglutaminase-like and TPR domain
VGKAFDTHYFFSVGAARYQDWVGSMSWAQGDVDAALPEEVALWVANDEYPHLSVKDCRSELDALAAGVAIPIANAGHVLERVDVLCSYLFGERGFAGETDDDDPRGNYLNDVLERRRGSPVALAVLMLAVARRVAFELEAIAFPGHFLVRTPPEPAIYVDPFTGGHPLAEKRLLALAAETLGSTGDAAQRLLPVGGRTIAVRLLLNLQRIHRQRADHARALVVCDRLFDLTRAPFHQADRGAHALALGSLRVAMTDFEAYLRAKPGAPDSGRIAVLMAKMRRGLEPPS